MKLKRVFLDFIFSSEHVYVYMAQSVTPRNVPVALTKRKAFQVARDVGALAVTSKFSGDDIAWDPG